MATACWDFIVAKSPGAKSRVFACFPLVAGYQHGKVIHILSTGFQALEIAAIECAIRLLLRPKVAQTTSEPNLAVTQSGAPTIEVTDN
jgi:hypothetical protein